MSASDATLIPAYKPSSFTERGVAVPFTTPQLAGARIRHADRTGTEFVVPNPSGGRGVYILHWGAVRQLCRPTVHDTLLHQRISRLPVMDPSGVRLTALKLAAEGMAGREAIAAAAAALAVDQNDLTLANFLMLIMLMEQTEPAGLRLSADTDRTPELDRRARRIVAQVAASIGRTAAQANTDLEALSALFVPVGLDAEMPAARLPRLTARLEAVARGLVKWSQAWAANPTEISKQVHRAEWILDGWERFCLLWETADHVSVQRAAMSEMAQLVPMLPKDATDWGDERRELEQLEPALRAAPLNTNWRGGGASHGLIARNERLQALIT